MGLHEFLAVHHGQGGLGVVAAGDAGQDVHLAAGQLGNLGLGDDAAVDNGLNGGLLALEVALKLGVDGQDRLTGALVPLGDHIGAAVGDVQVVAVAQNLGGLDVVVAVLLIVVVGEVAAVAVVHDIHVLAQPLLHDVGLHSGVGVGKVRGIVLAGHGQGEGVVVQQAHTGELLGAGLGAGAGVGVEVLKAHQGLAIHAGVVGALGHGGGEAQNVGQVVLGGDGAAVAELQVVINLNGVGAGAVVVLGLLMAFDHGLAPLVGAALVGLHGGQAAGQEPDSLVGRAHGAGAPAGITEIAGQLGGVAQDDLVLKDLLRPRGGLRRGRAVVGGGIALAAVLGTAAGQKAKTHHGRQQKRKKLLHIYSSSLKYLSITALRPSLLERTAAAIDRRSGPEAGRRGRFHTLLE